MGRRRRLVAPVFWTSLMLVFSSVATLEAQVPPEVAKFGYADTIVVNGKIVSMDDQGYNTNPGRVYEAMAVKGTRIMGLGTNQQMRSLAGSDTKVIDVGGRLVIPGIIETHAHLFGNAQVAAAMGIKTPDTGVSINLQAGKDFEATRLKIEDSIKDAVSKLSPGDWVNVGVGGNPREGVGASRVAAWVSEGELEPRERLDKVAPVNPVKVQSGTRATANSAAFDLMTKLIPEFAEYEEQEVPDVENATQKGVIAVGGMTAMEWDLWYRNQPIARLAEMIRRDWEMAAAHGLTIFGSRVHNPRIMESLTLMNREGAAPIRFMMLMEVHRRPNNPEFIRQLYKMTGNLTGIGNDMMYMGGVASELWDSSFPQNCAGADLPAPPNIKSREKCPNPGEMYWDTLQNALQQGWRLAGIHGVGSDGVRRYTQLIEMAMKNSGMTVEDIRKLRLTTEHAESLGNIPSLMAKIKELGIIISVNPRRMAREKEYLEDYGPASVAFMQPVKSWLDQGQNVVGQFEGYRGLALQWHLLITRNVNGKLLQPDQKLDRVTVLKMWTTWASRYMLKENDIGTLEVGKLADFVVLDKDFFTIPVDEILKIKPQMTVVGGKPRYLGSEFARQVGMEPVGWQYPPNYEPWSGGGAAE